MYSVNSFSAHFTVPCKYCTHVCIDSACNTCAYSTSTMVHCSPCIVGCTVCAQQTVRVFYIYNGSLLSAHLIYSVAQCARAMGGTLYTAPLELCFTDLTWFGGTHSSPVMNHNYYQYYIKITYFILYNYIFTDITRWNTQLSFYNCPTLPMKFQFQISLRCLCACCGGFPQHSFVCKNF